MPREVGLTTGRPGDAITYAAGTLSVTQAALTNISNLIGNLQAKITQLADGAIGNEQRTIYAADFNAMTNQVSNFIVQALKGELSSRNNQRFGDYTESVRNLAARPEFSATLVNTLSRLPGFRNVLIHEYVTLDFQQVVAALDRLEPVEEFAEIVRRLELEA